jgi:hypothetical protein
LPFHLGEAWSGFIRTDSFSVIAQTTDYNVLGKKYDVYSIKRSFGTFGYHVTQMLQVANGIGIVSLNIDLFDGFYVQKQQLDLIAYQLK